VNHVLALDQGTGSSRAIVFDAAGRVCALAQRELELRFPRPGWVEQDPEEILRTQTEVAREAVRRAGLPEGAIAAVGVTNQRETTVVWDRATGRPVCDAIVWQDRRTADLCADLERRGLAERFREKTGLVVDPYFSGTKLRWILDHVPGARVRAERGELAFGTVDSWLLWHLTGGRRHLTDATNAARTLLFDLHTGDWDEELLALLSIPRALLPEVCASSAILADAGALLGVEAPIAGLAGDQHAALFGQACLEPGMVKNTYGTGCFLVMNTGGRPLASRNRLLTTPAWRIGATDTYALEGSVFTAGAVVRWLRDGLGLIERSADVEALAASVPDAGGVYLVPAFSGLGAPHWDPYARGAVLGLTGGSGAGHLARAAIESIAYQSADVLRAMEADAGMRFRELRVDGGATANDLLMQFQADLLGVPVVRPAVTETTALGAAGLAGLAAGVWKDAAEFARTWRPGRTFEPEMSRDEAEAKTADWHRAVERAGAWAAPG